MGYCGPRGIPHSHFLGGPNEWTPDDRAKALAWHLYELERCPSCGTHPHQWDPEQGGDLNAYEPGLKHCRGCEVSAQADDKHEEHRKRRGRRGTSPTLRRPKPDPT